MRTSFAAFSAALLLASAASATPVSWVNQPGPINSRGLLGSANNTVFSAPLPSAGPWAWMTISGNLNKVASATQAREAAIEVTTPNGDKFIIKPFSTGAFSGTIPVPAGSATTPPYWTFGAGSCTLRFFELYADNASGPDATWTNLQITLHGGNDGDEPFPFSSNITTNPVDPDAHGISNFISQTNASTSTFVFPTSRIVNRVRIKGYGTAMNGWNASSTLSPLGATRYDITAPRADGTGDVTWTVTPFDASAVSSSGFDLWVDCPVPVRTGQGQEWTTRAYSVGGSAPVNATLSCVWIKFQPQLGNTPNATTLDIIRSQPWAPDAPVRSLSFPSTPGVVKWYTFVTGYECSPATGYWLDIHTQIPAGSPIDDHEMALFTQTGNRVALDDDGGSDHRSMLTFGPGAGVRPAVAPVISPEPRDGHDGVLAAGVHYLAVAQFDAQFLESGFYATTGGSLTGPIAVEIRTGLPPAPCGPADMGSQGGVAAPDWMLDNNDFVVFISAFFAHEIEADHGIQGGEPGADGIWDNNDFIVFIDEFFAGCV